MHAAGSTETPKSQHGMAHLATDLRLVVKVHSLVHGNHAVVRRLLASHITALDFVSLFVPAEAAAFVE